MSDIEAVVFDIGGVLIDWDPEYLYRNLIDDPRERRRFLTEVCSPEWNAAQDAGRPWKDAVAELIAEHPHHADLIEAYHLRWEEMVAGPIPGSVEILEDLRARQIPTYALTNFSSDKWEVAVARWQFLGEFDGAVVSGEEGVIKPDPAIYRILLDRFALDPERAFYVDDRIENVRAAEEVGMRASVFVDAPTLRRRLHELLTP
ncbi:MAG TPA: HAD family phosphatase [Acidimicrobiia bacterium]|nr:HAD family phosphatase [Acidimicrobiia bacterium]